MIGGEIWTHASKGQVATMLDGFVEHSSSDAVFVTSYRRPSLLGRNDYKGLGWVGKSHESDTPGVVRHSFSWIKKECATRGLSVVETRNDVYDFGRTDLAENQA